MATFTPPLVRDRPPYLADSTPEQVGLWRHFENRLRGVNVFKLRDGTYVQDTATTENANTNVPYPLHILEPNAPIVHVQNWDGSYTDIFQDNPAVLVYDGGHSYPISAAEAAALTAAGYGGRIT